MKSLGEGIVATNDSHRGVISALSYDLSRYYRLESIIGLKKSHFNLLIECAFLSEEGIISNKQINDKEFIAIKNNIKVIEFEYSDASKYDV